MYVAIAVAIERGSGLVRGDSGLVVLDRSGLILVCLLLRMGLVNMVIGLKCWGK